MSSFPGVSDLATLPDTLPDRLTNPSTQLGIRKGHTVGVTPNQSKFVRTTLTGFLLFSFSLQGEADGNDFGLQFRLKT